MRYIQLISALRAEHSAEAMDAIIAAARAGEMDDADVVALAQTLAESGDRFHTRGSLVADIASTGGPSSLSTLLCPLYLRHLGAVVPKLGVPGRPAGAVDTLAQIPGYRVALSSADVVRILGESGYAHFLAKDVHAPLDGKLFVHRQQTASVGVPELVIASLLSKKLAVGLRNIGLDVRVSAHGNFGSHWAEARANAARFVRVARLAGIEAHCFLTDGTQPCQPFVGRGEALLALASLFGIVDANPWILEHADSCWRMAEFVCGSKPGRLPCSADVREIFTRNLVAQGAGWMSFEEKVEETLHHPRVPLHAPENGFLRVDLHRLRVGIVAANTPATMTLEAEPGFLDETGVILRCRPSTYVLAGDCIAEVRCPQHQRDPIVADLQKAFTIRPRGSEDDRFEVV